MVVMILDVKMVVIVKPMMVIIVLTKLASEGDLSSSRCVRECSPTPQLMAGKEQVPG